MRWRQQKLVRALATTCLMASSMAASAAPVIFITQTPDFADFTTVVATFGNHQADARRAARGGDLWIRYDDGAQRNLTEEVGYGDEITVRDPCVHWDGTRALFSMVVGGVTQNDLTPVYFQIFEVSGIGQGDTVQIAQLPQENNYNNISPIYGSDDTIIFTTDRPLFGDTRLYPQLDEYESTPTNSGLWKMNADGSDLNILDHSPSGNFTPMIDSFGRIIFTRWDHLQRDQQAGGDIRRIILSQPLVYGPRTYESEDSDTYRLIEPQDEVFPERLFLHGPGNTADPTWDADHPSDQNLLRFNQFFPWMMNQDGTEHETINHIGRQELQSYVNSSTNDLDESFNSGPVLRDGFFQLKEDPTNSGRYYGTSSPEFGSHASGQVVYLDSHPANNPDGMSVAYITHPDTAFPIQNSDPPNADQVGLFRDPMPRSDGSVWVAHSSSAYMDRNSITDAGAPNPYLLNSLYDYRIRLLEDRGDGVFEPSNYLTTGITESISYFDNGRYRTINYNGPMWELQPVEVLVKTSPPMIPIASDLPSIETTIVENELGGAAGMEELRTWLVDNNLALVVSRDVTVRADKQQEYRLKVFESTHENTDGVVPPQEVAYMQFFEGKMIRGYDGIGGRRVLPAPMDTGMFPESPGAPDGAVRIGEDGSMASFVPAGRALTWQLTEADGTPSVRERYWVTFQPGEMRACANCHGINTTDVFGKSDPVNDPEALVDLMQWWKTQQSASIKEWQNHQ